MKDLDDELTQFERDALEIGGTRTLLNHLANLEGKWILIEKRGIEMGMITSSEPVKAILLIF